MKNFDEHFAFFLYLTTLLIAEHFVLHRKQI